MTVTADSLLSQIMQLTMRERGDLAARVIESLDDEAEPTLSEEEYDAAWAEELQKRLDDFQAGRAKAIPLDEVRRRLMEVDDGDR